MTCKAVEELWARCVLTLLGLAGISGQFHFKGELMCGRKRKKKLPFLTNLHVSVRVAGRLCSRRARSREGLWDNL